MADLEVEIDTIGGACPVQAEGRINGKPFYFRARGAAWRLNIGGDDDQLVLTPEWSYGEPYGNEAFAAGWMSEDEARGFIWRAARMYAEGQEGDHA